MTLVEYDFRKILLQELGGIWLAELGEGIVPDSEGISLSARGSPAES